MFMTVAAARGDDSLGIPWKEDRLTYVAQDEDLGKALQKICSSLGIQSVISDDVSGKISGRFDAVDADQFFVTLMQAYGLIWYYDGNAL